MENKNEKGASNAFSIVGFKHLYLKLFLSFLISIGAATGALFIAFAYQGQTMILFWSLFILHIIEIACALYCFFVAKTDAITKNKKITLLMIIFYVLVVFLLMLLLLEAIAFAKPTDQSNPNSTIAMLFN